MCPKKYLLNTFIIFISFYINYLVGQDSNSSTHEGTSSFGNEQPQSATEITIPTIQYIFPAENKVIFNKDIYLTWSNDTKSDRLQVSTDRQFNKIVVDTVIHSKVFLISALERHKTFYWRVVSSNLPVNEAQASTFFKTTSILIDESVNIPSLEIIPAWIDEIALLYFDNPDFIKYNVKIFNHNNEVMVNKTSKLEKFAIETESWPKGDYAIKLTLPNHTEHTKVFGIR